MSSGTHSRVLQTAGTCCPCEASLASNLTSLRFSCAGNSTRVLQDPVIHGKAGWSQQVPTSLADNRFFLGALVAGPASLMAAAPGDSVTAADNPGSDKYRQARSRKQAILKQVPRHAPDRVLVGFRPGTGSQRNRQGAAQGGWQAVAGNPRQTYCA
jgi:hypothetical protein